MHHALPLITTISVALALALFLGIIASYFKIPVLVGYLIAGVIIGPHTPGFVGNVELSQELAEIGVMLLMFGVGLHFSMNDLWAVRKIAIPGAFLQIVTTTAFAFVLAICWGWNHSDALILGLALSVASTVVLLRTLETHGSLNSISGHIAVGWLVVEDLVMVLVLVLLPPLAGWLNGISPGKIDNSNIGLMLATVFFKISTFILLMLVVGRKLFPKLLRYIARTCPRELFTLCIIAAAVSIAFIASNLFGVSFALGAFFSGMLLRESEFSHRAAEESLPFREAFAVLFFVSIGMLFDPKVLMTHPLQVIAVVSIVVVVKTLAGAILVRLFRYSLNTAIQVSVGLAQIGEFSFILAVLGVKLGLLSQNGQSLILAAALISITLNPLLFKMTIPLQAWIKKRNANLLPS